MSSLSKSDFDRDSSFDLNRVKPGPLTSFGIGKNCHSLFLFEKLKFMLKSKDREKEK